VADYNKAARLALDRVFPFRNRGDALAELGKWDRAVADFDKAVELIPNDIDLRWRQALALLASNQTKSYRSACKEILPRFRQTTNASIASFVAWTAVLAPDTVDDLDPYLQLVKGAVASNPQNYVYAYTFGAALYRGGKFREAARQLAEANKLHDKGGTAYDCLFLAMAHHRLGRADEATTCLNKGVQRIDHRLQAKSVSWVQRLEFQLLRREAEALIKRSEGPNDSDR
jgi:tetratricopeptide (TPR) repeat protein